MKKNLLFAAAFLLTSVAVSVPAYAAGWQKNDTGWWYATNDAGTTWYASEWQWIDGNGDGTAECYDFDANGYLYVNTTTPDGYTVNADGAWVVNGVVQTQAVQPQTTQPQTQTETAPENTSSNQAIPDVTGTYKGNYNGYPATALIELYNGFYYGEVDFFLKGDLPPYVGNGVFEDQWSRFVFNGNSLIFTDLTTGQMVAFVKVSD